MTLEQQKGYKCHAFGTQSKRFNLNGIHPNLLVNGRMPYDSSIRLSTSPRIGPGSYDLLKYGQFSEQNLSRTSESGVNNWERAFLTEKLAKMPHLLYQETHKKKQEEVIILNFIINILYLHQFQRIPNLLAIDLNN